MNISSFSKVLLSVVLLGPVCSTGVMGEDLLDSLHYPELEVTPLATERLLNEARREKGDKWTIHWAMQASAMATLLAGMSGKDKPPKYADADQIQANKDSSQLAVLVGGGWLATTLALSMWYTPYRDGYKNTKKMPSHTKKEELARERAAETALYKPASLGKKLMWISFLTNLAASGYLLENVEDDAKGTAILGVLLSGAPILFQYSWGKVADEHKRFKKKIYGPVAQMSLISVDQGKAWTPGLSLSMSF